MYKYVIFSTLQEAETRINEISDLIYNSGHWRDGITRYLAKATKHPTDDRGCFPIVPNYENYYSQSELDNAVYLDETWIPTPSLPL